MKWIKFTIAWLITAVTTLTTFLIIFGKSLRHCWIAYVILIAVVIQVTKRVVGMAMKVYVKCAICGKVMEIWNCEEIKTNVYVCNECIKRGGWR